MSDIVEQPAAEVDSATAATEATTAQAENTEQEGLLGQTGTGEELQTQQPEPDQEEVEYEGSSYKVPAALKDAILRYGDYTRKTQEVADQRREIEARGEKLKETEKLHAEVIDHIADSRAIEKRVHQLRQVLSQVNYAQLTPEQQPQVLALQGELTQLQAVHGQLASTIAQKHQQKQLAEQQETATLASKAEAFLRREIKDWSPQKDVQLADYAKSQGVDPKALGNLMLRNPAVALLVDKAAKFDRLMKQQTAKTPAPSAQPISRVTPKTSPATTVDEDKMSTDEWLAHREKQIAAQRKKR
jgi:hypothetical protein